MNRYPHVVFDLDGTLTDPGLGITNSIMYALEKYGIEKVDLNPATIESIRQASAKIWDEEAGRLYPRELLDRVLAILDEFRGQAK
mgnify:CR=1 FL=1